MTADANAGAGVSRLDWLRRAVDAGYTDEYDVKLRRLFPWPGAVRTDRPMTGFGVIWVVIEPGKVVQTHNHDEEECFIATEGEAELILDNELMKLSKGDVVYIPRFSQHSLRNLSNSANFVMIDVYWDEHSSSPATLGV